MFETDFVINQTYSSIFFHQINFNETEGMLAEVVVVLLVFGSRFSKIKISVAIIL